MPLVINGTLDLECGITTNTAERARNQAFSLTIFVAETRLMTRGDERVQGLADLRGLAVASTIGTTSIQHLAKVNEQQGLGIRILGGGLGLGELEGLAQGLPDELERGGTGLAAREHRAVEPPQDCVALDAERGDVDFFPRLDRRDEF